MKQTKAIVLTMAIMVLALVGLYACGGESPTATAVPPTATVAPPSPTSVPATPTTAAAPATSTTSSGTSGGGGSAASASDVAAIQQALATAKDLKSYHFVAQIQQSEIVTQPVNIQGDYVAPNTAYVKGTIGSQNIEQIIVGDHLFVKDASGNWVAQAKPQTNTNSTDPTQIFNSGSVATSSNPLQGIDGLFQTVKTYTNEGTETMDGAQVTKFGFKLNIADMMNGQPMPPGLTLSSMDLGGGSLWVDTNAKLLHKIDLQLNMGPLLELMSQAFASLAGTPTPGGAAPTPYPQMPVNLTITISKHNDPSISIPLTDEMKKLAAATPAATPGDVSTPAAGTTPAANATSGTSGQVVSGNIGDALALGDATLTVNSVRRSTGGVLPPGNGNEYVILNVTVENKGSQDLPVSGLTSFAVLDSAGKSHDLALTADYTNATSEFDTVANSTVKAGSKVTGEVGFEVTKGDTNLTLRFTPDFLLNTGSYVNVKIDK